MGLVDPEAYFHDVDIDIEHPIGIFIFLANECSSKAITLIEWSGGFISNWYLFVKRFKAESLSNLHKHFIRS